MIKFRKKCRGGITAIVSISILSFSTLSFGNDGDETLLKKAKERLDSLPQMIVSEKYPITPEKVKLGKILFYEPRISSDGTVSCSKCHPVGLYAADGLKKAIGNHCKVNPRNSPTLFNAAGQISAHWIGNRKDVEDQAKQSVTGPVSFGMPSYQEVEKKLKEIKGYVDLFKGAFPGEKETITIDEFAEAIGAFERTLLTPSPFDDFMKGKKGALTDQEKRGLRGFIEIGCADCHSGAFVGGGMYEKFGVFEPYWNLTKSEEIDEGRYAVTQNEADRYVFKIPMLRNVAKTPPYFHDGSVDRLERAVFIMAKIQLGKDLSGSQIDEILSFLRSLTGRIPEDVLRIPPLPSTE
jgi:cytochrome c peroxidase